MALSPKCDEQPYRFRALSQKGKGRDSRKEFAQFLYRARGSLLELKTQLFIAKELHRLEPLAFRRMEDRTKELGRILNGPRNSVLEGINVAS